MQHFCVVCFDKNENKISYGWLIEPFIKYDDKDKKLFRHPKPRYEITQVGEKIFAEKVTERPKYMGVPFKLR